MKKHVILLLAAGIFLWGFSSCETVKAYQKNKLNDAEMALSSRKIQRLEHDFQNIREGASGANGSKLGGGCGCN